jgi:hypothetical protein
MRTQHHKAAAVQDGLHVAPPVCVLGRLSHHCALSPPIHPSVKPGQIYFHIKSQKQAGRTTPQDQTWTRHLRVGKFPGREAQRLNSLHARLELGACPSESLCCVSAGVLQARGRT